MVSRSGLHEGTLIKRLQACLRRFRSQERGSWTIEAVIWTPMLVILMTFCVNITAAFYNEAQIVHVVQNVARLHSLGRFADDAEAEAEMTSQLNSFLGNATYTVDAQINGPIVTTSVDIAATELMPMVWIFDAFDGFMFNIVSEQLVEF